MADVQNIFVNGVSGKLITARTKNGSEKTFKSVSLPGIGNIAVNDKQVMAAKRKDGTIVEGMYNILLGKPGSTKTVSVGSKEAGYHDEKLAVEAIATAWAESRKAYRAAQETAQDAE